MENNFIEIVQIIKHSRANAIKAVNAELINLYWNVGMYIGGKLKHAEWRENTVGELAAHIQLNHPEIKGFSRSGLYRMVQFFECYSESQFVASLMRQTEIKQEHPEKAASLVSSSHSTDIKNTLLARISWTHHIAIFSRCKTYEEREFYIRQSIRENYSVRELNRQIAASLFERAMIGNVKLPKTASDTKEIASAIFKDSYVFDFLNLPESHNESDLQKGLVNRMKDFILELGRDFIFMGEEYKLMVGNSDFYIDLLFYHRGLQCLVAFELKAGKFKPEHIGQLNFYLEALDRDVKKEQENPSIGILLCKDRDEQVVEYTLSRSLSPTMVADYRTQLPNKEVLQQKLNDIFEEEGFDTEG